MRRRLIIIFVCYGLFCLTGCSTTPESFQPQTEAAVEPSKTPTPTTIWFPPTPTFTPFPSPTPGLEATISADLQFGKLILEDNFDQPNSWTFGKFGTGSVLFGQNELSIGINQEGSYLSSLRNGLEFEDFYLELTINPSICRGEDEFGILFHVTPNFDFFRFGINCNGEARLDRTH